MIRREKRLEIMKIIFITHLNTFGSKMFLILKMMDFENVALTKVVRICCDKRHECIIYMIYNQISIKMYLYLRCNVKWGI
jgi:hypothetical protein